MVYVYFIYLFPLILSLWTQIFKKSTAVLHLSSSQKTNQNTFFYFLDMSHISQQIILSSSLVKIFL